MDVIEELDRKVASIQARMTSLENWKSKSRVRMILGFPSFCLFLSDTFWKFRIIKNRKTGVRWFFFGWFHVGVKLCG